MTRRKQFINDIEDIRHTIYEANDKIQSCYSIDLEQLDKGSIAEIMLEMIGTVELLAGNANDQINHLEQVYRHNFTYQFIRDVEDIRYTIYETNEKMQSCSAIDIEQLDNKSIAEIMLEMIGIVESLTGTTNDQISHLEQDYHLQEEGLINKLTGAIEGLLSDMLW